MIDDRSETKRSLQRIADALGIETTSFFNENGKPPATCEALELLRAFERIVDPTDRRACLNFVHAVARRQQSIPS